MMTALILIGLAVVAGVAMRTIYRSLESLRLVQDHVTHHPPTRQ